MIVTWIHSFSFERSLTLTIVIIIMSSTIIKDLNCNNNKLNTSHDMKWLTNPLPGGVNIPFLVWKTHIITDADWDANIQTLKLLIRTFIGNN